MQHSHKGEPREYNTEHFIHLRVVTEFNYYKSGSEQQGTTKFYVTKIYLSLIVCSGEVKTYTNLFKSHCLQRRGKNDIQGNDSASIKPVRDFSQWRGCQHRLRDHPTLQTSLEAKYTVR